MKTDFEIMNIDIAKELGILGGIAVYIDGKEIVDCVSAKAGIKGHAMHYIRSDDGTPIIAKCGTELQITKTSGDVAIKWPNH